MVRSSTSSQVTRKAPMLGARIRTLQRLRYLGVVALLACCGCSTWTVPVTIHGSPKLPRPQMSRDSVGIQIATVTLNHTHGSALESVLQELDEQVLAMDRRRHLAKNGIRAGSFDTQLPAPIQLLLLEAADRREHPTAESFQGVQDQQRFVQCKADKRYSVPIWSTAGRLELTHFDDDTSSDQAFDEALCQMVVRCTPQEGEGATIRLTPEVEHGRLKQAFISEGTSFHLEARRDRQTFDDLTIELMLRPGETAMVTCSNEEDGLGQRFFRNGDRTAQKVLLVRLAQTQLGNLFGRPAKSRIATLAD